ncbi:MAG: TadE/TadG family type IV pilus assembly protein [Sphingomonadaceae bacterium]
MTRRAANLLRAIAADTRGVTLIEFAFVSPVLILLLMGLFDFGFQVYARSLLQGAMQEAARNSTLEGADVTSASLDSAVRRQVRNAIPNAAISFSRTNYANFSDVRQPEEFTDTNGDGECNNNEPFEDLNGNGTWDSDRGSQGLGGARDAVLYEATATFPRVFPLHRLMGGSSVVTVDASTVLRNQPFDTQTLRVPTVGNCT